MMYKCVAVGVCKVLGFLKANWIVLRNNDSIEVSTESPMRGILDSFYRSREPSGLRIFCEVRMNRPPLI